MVHLGACQGAPELRPTPCACWKNATHPRSASDQVRASGPALLNPLGTEWSEGIRGWWVEDSPQF